MDKRLRTNSPSWPRRSSPFRRTLNQLHSQTAAFRRKSSMRSFRVLYDECLRRQPLLTKMVTSSAFFGIGNRVAQRVEKIGKTDEELAEIDKKSIVQEGQLVSESTARTLRMMAYGGLVLSPILHNWHGFLERAFVGKGKTVVAKKVVADMVFMAPQLPIWFLTSTGLMAGKPIDQALDEAVKKQPIVLMNSYKVWPIANTFSFSFVPLQYRLLYNNVINIGWGSFLSIMSNQPTSTSPTIQNIPVLDAPTFSVPTLPTLQSLVVLVL